MKIATYNVNGIKSRLPNLLVWLDREKPDVACLQELKATDATFPAADLKRVDYDAIWSGQQSWNGVAILARDLELTEIRRDLPGDPSDSHSRFLEASVGPLIVSCLYLPNGNPQPGPRFDYKLAWFERLISHAEQLFAKRKPVIIAGDFNVVPTDFDIYNPRSWRKDALLQPESRACWDRLLQQGWVDSIRSIYPDQPIYTFWDYFRQHWEHNSGLRIDHLLLNRSAAKSLRSAGVDAWVRGEPHPSDHAPAWIEIDAKAKPNRTVKRRPTPKR